MLPVNRGTDVRVFWHHFKERFWPDDRKMFSKHSVFNLDSHDLLKRGSVKLVHK